MRAVNIKWRDDNQNPNLPSEVELPDLVDGDFYDAAEWLSDEYGYLVESYDIEE